MLRLGRDLDYRPLAEESPEYHRRLERHAFAVRRTSRLSPPLAGDPALPWSEHTALAIYGQVRSGVSVKIVDCRAFVPRSLACLMLMIRCRPASRRPDEDDHRAIEEPDGDEAILAVDPRGSRVAGR